MTTTEKPAPPVLPEWFEHYREHVGETGGNPIEDLLVRLREDRIAFTNLPVFTMGVMVKAQLDLLARLREAGELHPSQYTHIRQIGASRANLCDWLGGIDPSDLSKVTCHDCRRAFAVADRSIDSWSVRDEGPTEGMINDWNIHNDHADDAPGNDE